MISINGLPSWGLGSSVQVAPANMNKLWDWTQNVLLWPPPPQTTFISQEPVHEPTDFVTSV